MFHVEQSTLDTAWDENGESAALAIEQFSDSQLVDNPETLTAETNTDAETEDAAMDQVEHWQTQDAELVEYFADCERWPKALASMGFEKLQMARSEKRERTAELGRIAEVANANTLTVHPIALDADAIYSKDLSACADRIAELDLEIETITNRLDDASSDRESHHAEHEADRANNLNQPTPPLPKPKGADIFGDNGKWMDHQERIGFPNPVQTSKTPKATKDPTTAQDPDQAKARKEARRQTKRTELRQAFASSDWPQRMHLAHLVLHPRKPHQKKLWAIYGKGFIEYIAPLVKAWREKHAPLLAAIADSKDDAELSPAEVAEKERQDTWKAANKKAFIAARKRAEKADRLLSMENQRAAFCMLVNSDIVPA